MPSSPANDALLRAEHIAAIKGMFVEMDVDEDGKVTMQEFRRYLSVRPQRWPQTDLLVHQNEAFRDAFAEFFFTRLDVDRAGAFNAAELIAFFVALENPHTNAVFLTEFLMALFDENDDGVLDRHETARMLKVLQGGEPTAASVEHFLCGHGDRLSRESLRQKLILSDCDVHRMVQGTKSASGSDVVVAVAAGAALALAAVVVFRYVARHRWHN